MESRSDTLVPPPYDDAEPSPGAASAMVECEVPDGCTLDAASTVCPSEKASKAKFCKQRKLKTREMATSSQTPISVKLIQAGLDEAIGRITKRIDQIENNLVDKVDHAVVSVMKCQMADLTNRLDEPHDVGLQPLHTLKSEIAVMQVQIQRMNESAAAVAAAGAGKSEMVSFLADKHLSLVTYCEWLKREVAEVGGKMDGLLASLGMGAEDEVGMADAPFESCEHH